MATASRRSSTLRNVLKLSQLPRKVLDEDKAVLTLSGEICVVGNIQVLTRIFEKMEYPPHTTYLFLGD
jgi:hypothetical protein